MKGDFMEDLISVIVNVYNYEKYFKDCILSIISQTYRNMEIIIVDDGSSDSSSRICDELLIANSRMKVHHQLHLGIAESRNKGIELASGKYITFVNGCDKLDTNYLDNLHQMLCSYDVNIALCATYTNERKSLSDKIITFDREDALRQLLIEKNILNTPCGKAFDRSLFANVRFVEDDASTVAKLFNLGTKIAFMNYQCYYLRKLPSYSFNSSINKDMKLMQLYPDLSIYCKCNIVRTIQNEYFDAITNNRPVFDDDRIYSTFTKIVNDNGDDIAPFFSYVRKAHMYLLANDKQNYRIICPILPDLSSDV